MGRRNTLLLASFAASLAWFSLACSNPYEARRPPRYGNAPPLTIRPLPQPEPQATTATYAEDADVNWTPPPEPTPGQPTDAEPTGAEPSSADEDGVTVHESTPAPAPQQDYVWVPGHYRYVGTGYVWQAGAWVYSSPSSSYYYGYNPFYYGWSSPYYGYYGYYGYGPYWGWGSYGRSWQRPWARSYRSPASQARAFHDAPVRRRSAHVEQRGPRRVITRRAAPTRSWFGRGGGSSAPPVRRASPGRGSSAPHIRRAGGMGFHHHGGGMRGGGGHGGPSVRRAGGR